MPPATFEAATILVTLLSIALAGCGAEEPGAATPTPAATEPAGPPEALPSVPEDIAVAQRRIPAPGFPADIEEPVDRDADDGMDGHDADADADTESDSGPDEPVEPLVADLHWGGIGEARFGMDVEELQRSWPGVLDGEASGECFYLSGDLRRPAGTPALMFERARFVRFDVDAPGPGAPGGGRVGMDTEEILDRYGDDVARGPHKYTDGEYLRIENPDGEGMSVLLFETDEQGIVTEWRIGLEPQVDYVEGCS